MQKRLISNSSSMSCHVSETVDPGVPLAASESSESSTKTWTVSAFSGATVSDGVLKVRNPASAGMGQKVTVTCSTAYGQTKAVDVTVDVEDTLTITGDSSLNLLAGTEGSTSAFTVSGGSGNTLAASTADAGLTVRISDGKLYAVNSSAVQGLSATVTATSAAGQTASTDVSIDVYNQLIFNSLPTAGAIIYAV